MQRTGSELDLPGFRFHPTEEELIDYYLRHAVRGKKLQIDIIGTINLYRYDPWMLPGLAKIGEREWYFFVPRDRKQVNGGRPNRTTQRGFWKATGSDRPVRSLADPKRLIGLKKTLVYYQGRAPRGTKTDWVMNEYRLPDNIGASATTPSIREDIVLCKIYRKAASMRELEQRAAMEEEARALMGAVSSAGTAEEMVMSPDQDIDLQNVIYEWYGEEPLEAEVVQREVEVPSMALELPELQIPKQELDWMQDSYLTQLWSPWMMDQWSPYANLLNF